MENFIAFLGGHEVYVPPLRRGSSAEVNPLDKIVTEEISKPEKPIKSILKKPKEKSDDKPTDKSTNFKPEKSTDRKSDKDNSGTDDESYKRKQREQKEVNNFVQSKLSFEIFIFCGRLRGLNFLF